MGSVFISYRRADSQGEAGRLFDDLIARFGKDTVFIDVATLELGRDFRKAIQQSVSTCSALLAVIGQEWMTLRGPGGDRRLDDPSDFVRIEIAWALQRDIPVVPVLVRGARMPEAEQLPDDLRELSYRNALELTHARWKSDVQVLIQAMAPHIDPPPEMPRPALGRMDTNPGGSWIEAETVDRVGRMLAMYIGPISAVVVRRAATRCSRLEDFYSMAAQEIGTEGDRAKFLRACSR